MKTDELIINRTFNAPAEIVWKAWTEPVMFKRWWGPKDYSCPECRIDLRVGGKMLACMRSKEGQDIWGTGTYKEIAPMKKIVVTDSFADQKGNVVPASQYGMEGEFPMEMLITLTFDEVDGKTKMSLRHSGLPAGEMIDMTRQGWNESFDKLDRILSKK